MNYRLLGYLTLALAIIVTAPYWLRTLNSWTFKTKDKRFLNFLKFLRKIHKPLGVVLAAIALWHGITALGTLRLHTGTLAFGGFVLTAVWGVLHWQKKNKHIFKGHKALALLSTALVVLHLVWPGALRSLFGV